MKLINMLCSNNNKVIIDLDELKNSDKLKNANIFNRLFCFDNGEFAKEDMNKDEDGTCTLFKDYDISNNNWLSFLHFIRNGRVVFDMCNIIENEKERKSYQKLFVQELNTQSASGIFLKFGPIPSFDEYLESCLKNGKVKLEKNASNPMTPEEDVNKLYIWTSDHARPDESDLWEVTHWNKGADKFWRKLRSKT
jgi:hypothetical protein